MSYRYVILLFLIAIYLTILFIGFRKYSCLDKGQKVLLFYFGFAALIEIVSAVTVRTIENNIFLFHFATPIYYALVVYAFSVWLPEAKIKYLTRLSIPAMIIISIYTSFIQDSIWDYNKTIIWVICVLYTIIGAAVIKPHIRDYRFWSATALILFSSSTGFYFFLASNNIYNPSISIIHKIVLVLSYSLFIYSYLISNPPIPDPKPEEPAFSLDQLPLTPRQKKILGLVLEGHTSSDISGILRITSETVDLHRHNIRKAMKIKNPNISLQDYIDKISNRS